MDAWLIGLADAALAVPQRKGVPLPAVHAWIETGFFAVFAFALLAFALRGDLVNALGTVAIVGLVGPGRVAMLRRRRRDAEAWGPDLARRYRESAGRAVLRNRRDRMAKLGLVLASLPLAATFLILARQPDLGVRLMGYSMGVYAIGFMVIALEAYAACAMPRDPDARYRARTAVTA